MKTNYRWAGLGILLCLSTVTARESAFFHNSTSENEVHITIIYDNYQEDKSLGADWGFACLVEYQGHKMLFDAGSKADLYKKNLNLLEINPMEVPHLFISHEHGDHTAGMPWITSINPSIVCYLPDSYAKDLRSKDILPKNSLGLSEPTHLYGPFYSTGDDFQSFKEQGLVIKTDKGGLHLMRSSDNELSHITSTLKEMGIEQICPTHCTGDHSIAFFEKSFGEDYISGGTGKKIVIK